LPEARDQIEQAQKLEPSSTAILADKAYILWHLSHNNEGIALLTQLEASEPSLSSTHAYLGEIHWEQHEYAKSLAESRRSAELRHDENGLAIARAREKGFAANGLLGLYESELPVLKDLVDRGLGSAYALATVYAALGQRQEAISYLQVSYDRHEASMLMGDPIPELQNDPAFRKFRAQVNERLAQ
jgi:tetratricopeptide (TPR) repeat protein